MDSHLKNKKLKYLIHWKGYDDSDCMWEPKSHLGNVKDTICDFHKSHSSTPHALSIDPADFLLLFQKRPELFTEINPHHLPFDHLGANLQKGGSVTVPLTGTTSKQTQSIFLSFFILSNHFRLQTMRRLLYKNSLISHLLHFINTCLSHGKPCFIKPNFILDSSSPCCAWLCCHTHAHHTCLCFSSISATAMQLHHVINLHYACPRQYWQI